MLERDKMQMLAPAAIDNVSFHLNPSVRLEMIRFLPCSNSETRIHASAPQHTAKNERLFQAAGAKR